jgi:hypothetical protein
MKALKDVAIIEGNLARLLINYTGEFRNNGTGFEEFSDEAILYALLEYSKFCRRHTEEERIIYVHGKCLEYEQKPHIYVKVEIDNEQYGCFTVIYPTKKLSSFPF